MSLSTKLLNILRKEGAVMGVANNMSAFYDRLQALCKKEGLSISRLTTGILGLSSGTATQWKNGVIPSASIIVSIAEYFHVSTDYILGLTDEPRKADEFDPNNLEYLYDYLLKQLADKNPEAELLICELHRKYLESYISNLRSTAGISIEDVFRYSIDEKEARNAVREHFIVQGTELLKKKEEKL